MIHAAGGGEKNTTPADHRGLRGHLSGPSPARPAAMIDTLAHTAKLENGHIWAFLACPDRAILHAILHREPTHEREKWAAQRLEVLDGYYFTQSTIQHKVLYYTKYLRVEAAAPDHPRRPRGGDRVNSSIAIYVA